MCGVERGYPLVHLLPHLLPYLQALVGSQRGHISKAKVDLYCTSLAMDTTMA